ncbi:hypothetical protein ACS0TY_002224 [Phlomoides rotata]
MQGVAVTINFLLQNVFDSPPKSSETSPTRLSSLSSETSPKSVRRSPSEGRPPKALRNLPFRSHSPPKALTSHNGYFGVGVKLPTIEVRYADLRVAAECQVVYGKPLPTLWNSLKSLISDVRRLPCFPLQDTHVDIINDVTSMPVWLKWAFWLSPLSYGEIGLSSNEFLAPRWQKLSKLRGSKELEHSKVSLPEKSHKDRMVLPFEPLSIVFQDVQYYVETPVAMKEHGFTEKRLQLLRDITAAFRPGVLTALMGISGAGKTTLLDVLSGRKTSGTMEGEIRIGGYPKVQTTFARISGYCEQIDIHSPQITVEESVIFSAWLRLDPHVETKTKYELLGPSLDQIL